MKFGCKVKITNGKFAGMIGELVGIQSSLNVTRGWTLNTSNSSTVARVKIDEWNTVVVDSNNIEEVDEFPQAFELSEFLNFLSLRSNRKDWNESIKEFKNNNDSDVIFLETDNFSSDENEVVHMFTSLSVPQAKFLIENLSKVVEYIEKKSK